MYEVVVDGGRLALTFRELTPRDFYFFNLIENDYKDITQTHLSLLILMRLAGLEEPDLDLIPSRYVKPVCEWMGPELLQEKVMKVEQWLEMAFRLCKQRWDSSIDWMETQPVSKILLMAHLQSQFVDKQNEETKKAARKRK
jgi:hypothetical protein